MHVNKTPLLVLKTGLISPPFSAHERTRRAPHENPLAS